MSEFDIRDTAGSLGAKLGSLTQTVVTFLLDNWYRLASLFFLYSISHSLVNMTDYVLKIGMRYYAFTSFMHGWMTGPHPGAQ